MIITPEDRIKKADKPRILEIPINTVADKKIFDGSKTKAEECNKSFNEYVLLTLEERIGDN
ncbi:hypothetical protein [Prochlorococcus sp. ALOHA_ZT_50]|jgi:hypothetical protein|uniref:hypothetical protein n=1 Tax=Prochlorococcus sp. ALOHA_ZT_50 TaxID=2919303 RepID=UPI00257C04CC|nr:hypothetical protein [Prochlorococcus sp. ALOHA_ZT_50]MCH2079578.1 hypothetical protein [Prochlorococcus sp. ALOHA_ZT_50]